MLRAVFEVFFMGQIIIEKLDEEIRAKLKELGEQFNHEVSNGKQSDQWKAIDKAVDTVKEDYQQTYDALQELFRSTSNLACVAGQSGLPLIASKCNLMTPTTEKTREKVKAAKH